MKAPASDSPVSPNRRGFLRTSSLALGAAALSRMPIERVAHAAGSEGTLRVALVGCGGRGSGAANQALATTGGVRLVAAADAFRERLDGSLAQLAKQHPEKVDVPEDQKHVGLDAYKKAIAQADIVILATPPGFRPLHFEEAVRQGKHVFMEKPVCVDGPGFRRVMAAAEEANRKGLKVGVGLQRHHQNVYLETMKRVFDGAIGDIVAMRCYWNGAGVWVRPRAELERKLGRPPTEMEYQVYNWYYFTWLSGDHICEQHVHNLDVIQWVKQGKPYDPARPQDIVHPVRCWGMGGREVRRGLENGEIYDHHAVEYEYPDGSRLFSQCRHIPGCWSNVSEHLIGSKGTCNVGSGRITGPNEWRFRTERGRDAYQQEHDDLFAAIRGNQPFNEAFYGATSSMLAIIGRMATYSGKEIAWEDAVNSQISLVPEQLTWDAAPKVLPGPDGFYPVAVPGKTVTV